MTTTITITKTITTQEKVNLKDLEVWTTGPRDIDSIGLKIYYNEQEIGYGHLNNKKNYASITINEGLMSWEDGQDVEQYLVKRIEDRSLTLN